MFSQLYVCILKSEAQLRLFFHTSWMYQTANAIYPLVWFYFCHHQFFQNKNVYTLETFNNIEFSSDYFYLPSYPFIQQTNFYFFFIKVFMIPLVFSEIHFRYFSNPGYEGLCEFNMLPRQKYSIWNSSTMFKLESEKNFIFRLHDENHSLHYNKINIVK